MPSFDFENQHPNKIVSGIDEAGLGPLAGPLVVCSCIILNQDINKELIDNINDSKKLTKNKREYLFEQITQDSNFSIGLSIISNKEIDEIGLSKAWIKGVIDSTTNNKISPQICLLDGRRNVFIESKTTIPIVKGDQKSFSIAAASIIAKVTRDKLMEQFQIEFPSYGFSKNAGYGTKEHIAALKEIGPCRIHRKSFAPVAQSFESISLKFDF